ncbi:MAG: cupin domain-containing protein, partial [Actinomycetota bacterium]
PPPPPPPDDVLWRVDGGGDGPLVGALLSTPELRVETCELRPGIRTATRSSAGDIGLYVREGELTVDLPSAPRRPVSVLRPGDGYFLPAGTPYRLANDGAVAARWCMGTAPGVA